VNLPDKGRGRYFCKYRAFFSFPGSRQAILTGVFRFITYPASVNPENTKNNLALKKSLTLPAQI